MINRELDKGVLLLTGKVCNIEELDALQLHNKIGAMTFGFA